MKFNQSMEPINIHGKDYVTVNARVNEFLKRYPTWSMRTRILTANSEECLMVTEIFDDRDVIRSTGHAYERQSTSNINKTSHVENCETSAVGRALGFLGIGIVTSIASADEVLGAISEKFMTTERLRLLETLLSTSKVKDKARMKKDFPNLTQERFDKALQFLKDNQNEN